MMDDLSALMFVNGSVSPSLLGNGEVFLGAVASSLVDQGKAGCCSFPVFFSVCVLLPLWQCALLT